MAENNNNEIDRLSVGLELKYDQFSAGIDGAKKRLVELANEAKILKQGEKDIKAALASTTAEFNKQKDVLAITKQAYGSTSAAYKEQKAEVDNLGKQIKRLNADLQENGREQANLKNEIKDCNKSIASCQKGLKDLAKDAQNSGNGILHVANMIKALAVGYAGKKLYEALIGSNADFEQSLTSFEVLLNSADKAQAMMNDLTNFANKTPFQIPELQKATSMLLGYGVEAKNVMTILSQLGDLSQGNAEKLNRISLAYGQMVAKGKVTGEEMRQMTEAQVPLLQGLAEYLGVTTAKLSDWISDGKVGIKELNGAIEAMTSNGGKFAGMMEKQSQTMSGMVSTIQDLYGVFMREVGEGAFDTIKEELREVLDTFAELSADGTIKEVARDLGESLANTVENGVKFVKWLYDARTAIVTVTASVLGFKAAFAIGTAIDAAITSTKGLIAATTALNTLHKSGITLRQLYNLVRGQSIIIDNTELAATLAKTGAITAETVVVNGATQAQIAWNAAQMANPIGLIVGLIGMAIAAIVGYNAVTNSAAQETENLNTKLADVNQTLEQNYQAAEKSMNADLGKAEVAKRLTDNLYDLEEQVKSGTLSDAEAAATKERMRGIIAQLNSLIPGLELALNSETGELNKQKSVVDALTQSFINLAYAKAYAAKMETVASAIIDAKQIQKSAAETMYDNQAATQRFVDTKGVFNKSADDFEAMQRYNEAEKAYKSASSTLYNLEYDMKQLEEGFKDYAQYLAPTTTSGSSKSSAPVRLTGSGNSSSSSSKAKDAAEEEKKRLEELRKAAEAEYDLRLKNSQTWIETQKFYGRLSVDEELAALERIRAYTQEYYDKGVIDFEKYEAQIIKLEKDAYSARKKVHEDWRKDSNEYIADRNFYGDWEDWNDTEASAILRQLKKEEQAFQDGKITMDEYYSRFRDLNKNLYTAYKSEATEFVDDFMAQKEKELKQKIDALNAKETALRDSWTTADRNESLDDLRKQEAEFKNAVTKQGQDEYKRIQTEIKRLEREEELYNLQKENQEIIEKWQHDFEELEQQRNILLQDLLKSSQQAGFEIKSAIEGLKNSLDAIAARQQQTTNNYVNVANSINDRADADIFGRSLADRLGA